MSTKKVLGVILAFVSTVAFFWFLISVSNMLTVVASTVLAFVMVGLLMLIMWLLND